MTSGLSFDFEHYMPALRWASDYCEVRLKERAQLHLLYHCGQHVLSISRTDRQSMWRWWNLQCFHLTFWYNLSLLHIPSKVVLNNEAPGSCAQLLNQKKEPAQLALGYSVSGLGIFSSAPDIGAWWKILTGLMLALFCHDRSPNRCQTCGDDADDDAPEWAHWFCEPSQINVGRIAARWSWF